jgi:DNA-binding transcriptional ArsR family regulator
MPAREKTLQDPALIDLKVLERATEFLKTLAHPHRLRILQLLIRGRYTVGDLAVACGIPSNMASEHLRHMQWCGLLTRQKDGRKNYYQIADPALPDFMQCIESRFACESSRLNHRKNGSSAATS